MIDLDWSVTELARRVNRPRPSVSAALNTNRFPLLRKKLKEALHA